MPELPPGAQGDRLERARSYLAAVRSKSEEYHRARLAGLSVCRLITEGMDRLLQGLFAELSGELSASGLCLAALGGYGRKELAPRSDVDLLLLRGGKAKEAPLMELARLFTTLLWDLKLQVGWSARTAFECAGAAEADHTVRTALLDCRFLAGDQEVYRELEGKVLHELLAKRAEAFIADKRAELAQRRERFGDSVYLLEPHVKQGEGGLRDLEAALWIAQARFRTRGLTGLLKKSVLPASEVATLGAARDFLLRVRNHLHCVTGRKEDRLTFELQEAVAHFLGYAQSESEGLAVEQFMRHYYLCAKAIRRAADSLIARCEETAQKPVRDERRFGPFRVFRGRLTVEDAGLLQEDPSSILRLFRVSEEEGLPLYSWARDQVAQALPALARERGGPRVVEEALALFSRPGTRGQFLFELHEVGALGALLPEFGRITARASHDLYHVYTVDLHSLFATRRLYQLRAGDLIAAEPAKSRVMQELSDPLPLTLAALLHDCGKGMGGQHSLRGMEFVREVCLRLGLTVPQRELVEFLVREHLAMSHTAQRRDLADPDLLADFARLCGGVDRLSCLYLLTWADISSVGPNMWTEWKARLHDELFLKARERLAHGRSEASAAQSKERLLSAWRSLMGEERALALAGTMPERYFATTEPKEALLHARLLARARLMALSAAVRQRREGGHTELTLCATDRPGLLKLFTGVLAAYRIDILRARVLSTRDGLALDSFDVQGPGAKRLDAPRWRAARADLFRALEGKTTVEEVQRRRRTTALFQRPLPKVQTHVSVDNRASAKFSVVDVRAEDRVGLLHAIASALSGAGLEITLAKIATEAHSAIDSFYVTRRGEKVVAPEEVEALVATVQRAIEELQRG